MGQIGEVLGHISLSQTTYTSSSLPWRHSFPLEEAK